MPSLLEKLEEDLKAALKAKSEIELSVLRLLKSDIQLEKTKPGNVDLTDEFIQSLIKRAVKKRNESIEQFSKAGRNELAEKEQKEIEILQKYLPVEISQDQINPVIEEIINKTEGEKHTGKITGMVMARFKGQNINGSLVKELVEKRLKN